MYKNFIREPLFHFLLIGVALFILYSVVNPEQGGDKRIVVDDGRINHLSAMFEKNWNRQPSEQELKKIIDDYVLEEIYYRQALEMGIDKNDVMIRRRLRQKMEFFTSAAASMVEPETVELEAYLHQNADKYRTDNRYSFEQIYISTDRSHTKLTTKITQIQKALQQSYMPRGDASLLPNKVDQASAFNVDRSFGKDFSHKLDTLALNEWSEPLTSGLGVHFVKVTARQAGGLPSLQDVQEQVTRDWMYQKTQILRADIERKMLDEYDVIVSWTAATRSSLTGDR
ncbi:peptidyl-prolyl cis-trans isomerase [Thalassotalea aquiviva]|uniref:peptidyl-prolyl cis-trans isomerase n=1 Tax=Thalassotalea aquiviva TaxID=3242415 RepID=UPI00352A3AC2